MSSDFFDRCLASMMPAPSLNPHEGTGGIYSNVTNTFTTWEEEDKEEYPLCPKCGSEMIERSGMYGKFFGCKNFPRCKGSRNIT